MDEQPRHTATKATMTLETDAGSPMGCLGSLPQAVGPAPFPAGYLVLAQRLIDFLATALVGVALYVGYVAPNYPGQAGQYLTVILIASLVANFMFNQFAVYDEDAIINLRSRTNRILTAWAITFALLLAAAFALKISSDFSRVWLVFWFAGTPGLLTLSRMAQGRFIRRWAASGRLAMRSAIVGLGEQSRRLIEHLNANPEPRIRIMGFVSATPEQEDLQSVPGPHLGDVDALVGLIREGKIDQVFVALPWQEERLLQALIHKLALTPVAIRLAPDLIGFAFHDRGYTRIGRVPMLQLFDRPISGWEHLAKAIEDRILGTLFLVLLSPLLFLTALAIKLDSRGPVFFKQPRYGFNHQLIDVWKFRSMYSDRSDSGGSVQATKDDPRVTRVGRIIRKFSLDELPQLFNVVGGSMSLVGPRPHPLETKASGQLLEDIVEGYAARHRVKPGITGWAQVNGWRGETDTVEKVEQRIEHDLYYIDHWSVWFDLWIMLKTLLVIFRDDNAY